MYPSLHDDVERLLEENDLHFTFHDIDDPDTSTRDYNTNTMSRFACTNKSCKSKDWSSNKIAITIRMYAGQKYNARVYFQHSKNAIVPVHRFWISRMRNELLIVSRSGVV